MTAVHEGVGQTRARRPAPRHPVTAVAVVVGAVGVDLMLHGRVGGVGGAAFVVTAVVTVLLCRPGNRQSWALALVAVAFTAVLLLRADIVLTGAALLGALIAVGAAALYARGGSVMDLGPTDVLGRIGDAVVAWLGVPAVMVEAAGAVAPGRTAEGRRRLAALGRGLLLALPVVVLLGALLVAADAVFASVLRIPVDAAGVAHHSVLLVAGALAAAVLVAATRRQPAVVESAHHRWVGPMEAGVVLGAVAALFAAFAAVQAMVAVGGDDYVRRTAGVTYASSAREGFFQLLGVAAVTLLVLLALRVVARPTGGRGRVVLVVLSEAVVGLTLVIVAVALARLRLYEQAYGLTPLRLGATIGAWWLAAVFVIVALAVAGLGASRRWVGAALAASLAVTVLVVGAMDPDGIIVRRNVALASTTGRFDASMLYGLSDDAIPEVARALPDLPPADRAAARAWVCRPRPPGAFDVDGLRWNRAVADAASARREVCDGPQ